jgi:hypothetical protein
LCFHLNFTKWENYTFAEKGEHSSVSYITSHAQGVAWVPKMGIIYERKKERRKRKKKKKLLIP